MFDIIALVAKAIARLTADSPPEMIMD